MQRLAVSLVCLAAMALAAQWKPIQPDPRLAGWTRVPIPTDANLDSASPWSVRPFGDLLCDTAKDKGREWLRYDRELKDFVLHVEWRFFLMEGVRSYSSGVFVRTSRDGAEWFKAPAHESSTRVGSFVWNEMANGASKPAGLKDQLRTPDLRELGEWNSFDIRAEGKRVTLRVNGDQTSAFDCPRLTGYIGVEGDGSKVEFRNLRIQELP